MDSNLPPLKKRFRMLHQHSENQNPNQQQKPNSSEINLPAKKRKQPRETILTPITHPPTSICLPAKKRIWAIKPDDDSPIKPTTIDLNLVYHPSPEKNSEPEKAKPEDDKEEKEEDIEEEEEGDDGIVCAVCDSTDGDPTDPIVFCDGCNLMVHVSCYGHPLINGIPEGDWLCTQCDRQSTNEKDQNSSVCCCLCPASGGAMKPTTDGKWAHIVCAVLVPEVFFEDSEGREGINCSQVPKKRWKERCYLCRKKKGCVVECSESKCPLGFHVTCGLKAELTIELKEGNVSGIVAAFCKKHTDLWEKQRRTGKFKIVARE